MVEGRTLYIVDRTALRRYDLRTQSWLAPIALPDDRLFYNDVCSSGQGRIYVTGTDFRVLDIRDGRVLGMVKDELEVEAIAVVELDLAGETGA